MRYQEYKAPIELSSWVKLFWIFENRTNDPVPEKIVADGFPELIVHFRSPFSEPDQVGKFFTQPTALVCGQLTRPLMLHSSPDAGMIGIRFHPNGLAPFLSTPMYEMTDSRIPAEHLLGNVNQLIESVVEAKTDLQRIAACTHFLVQSLRSKFPNSEVRYLLNRINQTRGRITVETLANKTGLSRRRMELIFRNEIGISPKLFCRIARFRHVFDFMTNSNQEIKWVNMALDSGFWIL